MSSLHDMRNAPERASPPAGLRTQMLLMVELIDATPHWLRDEAALVQAWSDWLVQARLGLAGTGGQLVKAVGDSCMMRFDDAGAACGLALELLQRWPSDAHSLPGLRAALHESQVLLDATDLFGSGPNLGARLCGLGLAGQLVVSRPVLQSLPAASRAAFRDLGHCYLKHWPTPVHAFVREASTNAPAGAWSAAGRHPSAPHSPHAPGPSSHG